MLKNVFYRLLGKKILELIAYILVYQISSERTQRRRNKEKTFLAGRTSTGKFAFRK